MLNKLNQLISSYISLILLSGIIAGLLFDIFSNIGNTALAIILFIELFLACFKINIEDAKAIKIGSIIYFFIFRFLVLGIIFYYLGLIISPHLAIALLLLCLLPCGVSSPGFTSLFQGNVALSIALVLLSSLLAPFYIPLIIQLVASAEIKINSIDMLITILLIVVLPIIIHLPLRKSKRITSFFVEQNSLLLMPLVWLTIAVPIARYRHDIFDTPLESLFIIIAFCFLYLFYAGLGFIAAKNHGKKCQTSYALVSLIHNITLGIVIALMYFPDQVSKLLVLANVSIIITIVLFKSLKNRFIKID